MRVSADRIAVVRAREGVGELLAAVPALRALREHLPHAHITLIGLPGADWFAEVFSGYVDELVRFPGFPGVPGVPFDACKTTSFLRDMHERELDLAIQLHGWGIAINAFTALLGATHAAGSVGESEPPADPDFFVEYDDDAPEPVRTLRVIERLGAKGSRGTELEFPLGDAQPPGDLEPGHYACVHVSTGDTERLAERADGFARDGLRVVLIGDGELVAAVRDGMRADALDLAGELSWRETAALLRDAQALVCEDPGVSAIAEAVCRQGAVDGPELAATGTER